MSCVNSAVRRCPPPPPPQPPDPTANAPRRRRAWRRRRPPQDHRPDLRASSSSKFPLSKAAGGGIASAAGAVLLNVGESVFFCRQYDPAECDRPPRASVLQHAVEVVPFSLYSAVTLRDSALLLGAFQFENVPESSKPEVGLCLKTGLASPTAQHSPFEYAPRATLSFRKPSYSSPYSTAPCQRPAWQRQRAPLLESVRRSPVPCDARRGCSASRLSCC